MENKIIQTISDIYPEIDINSIVITVPKNKDQGDYSTNVAMRNSKVIGGSPRDIAQTIVDKFKLDGITKVEVAGPGFINFYASDDTLAMDLDKVLDIPNIGNNGNVPIDYSSPNIAKKMHIAHLRSTAIGDSVKRIMNRVGYNAFGVNHIGDWGTQFGKLIVAYRLWINMDAYKENPIDELERIYIKFAQEVENNPDLDVQARAELVKVQNKDPENYKLWQEFIDYSMTEYQRIYDILGVDIEHTIGESFYNDMMPETTKKLVDAKIAVEDDGAMVAFFDHIKLHPAIVQKSDGAFGYTASDVSAILYREQKWDPAKMLYVVDSRQGPHFKQVFDMAKRLGVDKELVHIDFGVMSAEFGNFSTRKGNIIRLDKLINEGYKRAFDAVTEKNPDYPLEEREEVARVVSIGAIKYFDLSQNRTSDIIFTWDKALAFEGNTSSYLQYTNTRIRSVITKSGLTPGNDFKLITDEEKDVAKLLKQYSDAVVSAADKYRPNIIANYLFELAQKFNTLYNKVNFIADTENLQSRVNLINVVANVIEDGLSLLGIKTLGRM